MFELFQADATSFVTISKLEKSFGVGYNIICIYIIICNYINIICNINFFFFFYDNRPMLIIVFFFSLVRIQTLDFNFFFVTSLLIYTIFFVSYISRFFFFQWDKTWLLLYIYHISIQMICVATHLYVELSYDDVIMHFYIPNLPD